MIMSRRGRFAGVAAAGLLLLAGCSGGGDSGASGGDYPDPGDGTGEIEVWAKQGQEGEVQALQKAIKDFEASQSDVTIKLQLIAQDTYGQTLTTTAVENLPDVLMIGGENMAAHVYALKLRPLDDLLAPETISNQIASMIAQGTYKDGNLYAVGQFDSGLGIWGNKSLLEAAGVDYPTTVEDAWTWEEFKSAVEATAAKDPDGKSLNAAENYPSSYAGYAYTPLVNSAGYPLVGEDGSADGNLNAPEVAQALTDFATLRQYTDANADDLAFNKGRVAFSWYGHWMYPAYSEDLGDDLVLMPLPDFGNGTKTGQGSNAWSISSTTEMAAAGAKFIDFLMADDQVKEMTDANGAPPGTTTATAASTLYQEGGPLELYAQQLAMTCGSAPPTPDCVAVPRTISPAWPVIQDSFSKAFWAIWQGGNAQSELDDAAKLIDLDYSDNNGYED